MVAASNRHREGTGASEKKITIGVKKGINPFRVQTRVPKFKTSRRFMFLNSVGMEPMNAFRSAANTRVGIGLDGGQYKRYDSKKSIRKGRFVDAAAKLN
jgi:hypothetical protein